MDKGHVLDSKGDKLALTWELLVLNGRQLLLVSEPTHAHRRSILVQNSAQCWMVSFHEPGTTC